MTLIRAEAMYARISR